MKNKFIKLSILALSMICILANDQAKAAERRDASLTQSGMGNSLMMSQLQQSLMFDVSQLTEQQQLLMAELLKSVKRGENLSSSTFDKTSRLYKQEFEILSSDDKCFLRTKINPSKMSDAFGILFNIYHPGLTFFHMEQDYSVFKNLCNGLDKENAVELTNFLLSIKSEDLDLICNPSSLIIFLKMLRPLDLSPCFKLAMELSQNDWNVQHLLSVIGGKKTFDSFMRLKSHSFIVEISALYNQLINVVEALYLQNIAEIQQKQAVKEKIKDSIKVQFNQIFNFCGTQWFDIAEHGQLIDTQLSKWMNNSYTLSKYEIKKWAQRGVQLEQFQTDVDWARNTLTASLTNKKMYSGAPVAPYTISLTETSKEDKAESPDFLNQVIDAHVQSHEEELKTFNNVKDALPTVKKGVELFEDVGDFLKKAGKTT